MQNIDLRDYEDRFARYVTRKVAMRPMSYADVWPLWHATRNPAFNEFLLWSRPGTVRQLVDRIDRIADQRRIGRMAATAGVIRATGEWVCALRTFEIEPPEGVQGVAVEGGIWVHPKFWKSGLAVELARLCVDSVFRELDITLFRASAASSNKASHAMLKASGFVFQRESIAEHESGLPIPAMDFEIYREQWVPWFNQEAELSSPEYEPDRAEIQAAVIEHTPNVERTQFEPEN